MKFWLGVTDNGWFDFLSREQPDEVNFWQPTGKAPFVNLEPGAPFLFKLKRPFNHVGGGGYFLQFRTSPLSVVWEAFGTGNGARSRTEFEKMIRRLAPGATETDPMVGCTILSDPFFWPRERWIPAPSDWTGNIVRGRYYDTADPIGAHLWSEAQLRNVNVPILRPPLLPYREQSSRYGGPALYQPRLGQGSFRLAVADAYNDRCAITGESTRPVLEAAHILPYAEEGPHEVANGMLLRSDFHKLFDIGLVTVTPELAVEVSSKIREAWFNGKAYYRLHGQRLASIPSDPALRPAAEFLRWHNDNRFQG